MLKYDELIKNINILLADDDEDYLNMTYSFLKQKGYNITKVMDGEAALEELKTGRYQIALLDYYMPKFNGEEVVTNIRKQDKELIIILQTGFSGQNPPVDTLKKLEIQNYFDKTEGIDKLNMQLISAVKIFDQQNEIKIAQYKARAMGKLMAGIAQNIKIDLMNVSAGNEVTNMVLNEAKTNFDKENFEKLNEIYLNNRTLLDNIDKALSSVISQKSDSENKDYIMMDEDIIYIINLIIQNDVKINSIDFVINNSLKTKSYISGSINDTIYVICEMLKNLMSKDSVSKKIELVMTEDEQNWIFKIKSDIISTLASNEIYIYNNVILSLNNELKVDTKAGIFDIFIKK